MPGLSSVPRHAAASPTSSPIWIFRQVSQYGLAGFCGLSKRFKGRTADPDGGRISRERAPRCHIAGRPVKAGTAAALVTDHEGKAGAAGGPDFHGLDGTNDASELQSHSTVLSILDTRKGGAHGCERRVRPVVPALLLCGLAISHWGG